MPRGVVYWLVILALTACTREAPGASRSDRGLPLGDLEVRRDGRRLLKIEVEIAETTEARSQGLMRVRNLPDSKGMAFLNPEPSRDPFYMKNTLIPLDVAFWDRRGRIVDILTMEPCRSDPCPFYYSSRDYLGALEVNAGLLKRRRVRVTDVVVLKQIN